MNNLKLGKKGSDVSQLQQFLQGIGMYNGAVDGIFGPQTQNAVVRFQQGQGITPDGIVGPITSSKIQSYGATQNLLNDPRIQQAMQNDPALAEKLNKLQQSGDVRLGTMVNSVLNQPGLPVDKSLFTDATNNAYNELQKYYEVEQSQDRGNIEDQLGLNKRNFDRYLESSAAQFGDDKNALDKNSADKGILFSSAREQAERGLQNRYTGDLASKRDAFETNARTQLRNYQYNWGQPATDSLSSYMSTPGQTYNASTPRNNVNQTGLSSFYNPSQQNLGVGTRNLERQNYAYGTGGKQLANYVNRQNRDNYKTLY